MARNLSPDESALWARVMASVRPMRTAPPPRLPDGRSGPSEPAPLPPSSGPHGRGSVGHPARSDRDAKKEADRANLADLARTGVGGRIRAGGGTIFRAGPPPPATLDKSWDKRLTRGLVSPDATVDLHGHTLHSAHDLLDAALTRAIARGDRVVLLVTGRPPRPESERPHARGAIRAAVGDWLAASRHATSIAAVRGAHPRHGGAGALYLILRRAREPKS